MSTLLRTVYFYFISLGYFFSAGFFRCLDMRLLRIASQAL